MANNLLLRQKYHQYKIYSPAGAYLGLLQNVTTPFQYNQNIATAFTQLQITVGQSADVASQAITPIQDEQGNPITDEAVNNLLIERQPDIVGSTNSNALIANNNLIKVYEYSNYYPNGLLKFSGYISKWKAVFGGTDNIELTCLSQGTDMNQILVQTGDAPFISQATDDGSTVALTNSGTTAIDCIQTFSVATIVSIDAAAFEISVTSATAQVGYYLRQQVGTQPDLNNDVIITYGLATPGVITKQVQKILFNSPATLSPGNVYYVSVHWVDSSTLTVYGNSSKPYPSPVYTASFSGTSWSGNTPISQSMYFIIYQHNAAVTGAYTNDDPSFIVQDVMNNYISQGGNCSIPASTINALISQPIKDNTILGGVWSTAYAQIIKPTNNMSIDTVQYRGDVSGAIDTLQAQLYKGDPSLDSVVVTAGNGVYTLGGSNSLIATTNAVQLSSATDAAVTLAFSTPVSLTGGTQYYLVLFFNAGQSAAMLLDTASSTDTIADPQVGKLYMARVTSNNTTLGMATNTSYPAMYIVVGLGAGSSPAGGYINTGNITSYTFKLQTVLQAIQTLIGLAPSTWYWYVQPDTNQLNFAKASTSADITLIHKRHINEIDIEATKENIKTVAYFSGGDDGTGTSTNILVKMTSAQGSNRIGLALLSDNRVNSTTGSTTTARLIASNFLNVNSAETYITNVTIQDQTMDINLIKLGMIVGFSGFGNFVDNLLLQVVGINYQSDQAILQLGTLPKRDTQVVAAIQAALQYAQTVASATTPS